MDIISVNILLEYLYKKFAVTFILCLMGAFLKQSTLSTKKVNKLKLIEIISPTIFSTILICAISDYLKVSFSMYAAMCLLIGMWSSVLIKVFLNLKFIKKFVAIIFKNVSGPLAKFAKYSDDLLEDIEEEEAEEKEKDKKDDEESDKKDSSSNNKSE